MFVKSCFIIMDAKKDSLNRVALNTKLMYGIVLKE